MQWPPQLYFLSPLQRMYQREYALRVLLAILSMLVMLNACFLLLRASFFSIALVWRLLANASVALFALSFYVRRRPGLLELSRRMDRELLSAERIQTYLELSQNQDRAETPGEMTGCLLLELKQYFTQHPPMVRFHWRSFYTPAFLLVLSLLFLVTTFFVSPALSQANSAKLELQAAKEEALATLEEVEELVAVEPMLDVMQEELVQLREQVANSEDSQELLLLLQEARELLEQQREQLMPLASSLQQLQDNMNMQTADTLATRLADDPQFRQELVAHLEQLLASLPAGEVEEALADFLGRIEEGKSPTSASVTSLQEALQSLTPEAALQALAQGAASLAQSQDTGVGSGTGEGSGSNTSASSGNDEDNTGEVPSSGGSDGSGSGSGTSGAGTGSATPNEHEFFYIPGEQEIALQGEGEEGQYTLQDIMRYNPSLTTDNYADNYQRYYRQGTGSLQSGEIPAPLTGYVREYFEAIAP
ncbi:MAG: hypothetical protein NUK65_09270 [Firmicutes bacterium]|nr:hypothetical protein [Bacillota bacterium]